MMSIIPVMGYDKPEPITDLNEIIHVKQQGISPVPEKAINIGNNPLPKRDLKSKDKSIKGISPVPETTIIPGTGELGSGIVGTGITGVYAQQEVQPALNLPGSFDPTLYAPTLQAPNYMSLESVTAYYNYGSVGMTSTVRAWGIWNHTRNYDPQYATGWQILEPMDSTFLSKYVRTYSEGQYYFTEIIKQNGTTNVMLFNFNTNAWEIKLSSNTSSTFLDGWNVFETYFYGYCPTVPKLSSIGTQVLNNGKWELLTTGYQFNGTNCNYDKTMIPLHTWSVKTPSVYNKTQIAIVRDGSILKFYKDGVYETSRTTSYPSIVFGNAYTMMGTVTTGSTTTPWIDVFTNSLSEIKVIVRGTDVFVSNNGDELKVYDRILLDSEILTNYTGTIPTGDGTVKPTATIIATPTITATATIIATATVTATSTVTATPPPTSTPISHWSFNEGTGIVATDVINGNNLNLINNPLHVVGKKGNAIKFDGVNDYASKLSAVKIPTNSPMSIAVWIKPVSMTKWSDIIRKSGSYALQTNSAGYVSFEITGKKDVTSTVKPTLNAWTHVVMVFNSGSVKFYKNGVLTSTVSSGGYVPNVGTNNIYVGGTPTTSYFNGVVDELQIFNKALTQSEVTTEYNR